MSTSRSTQASPRSRKRSKPTAVSSTRPPSSTSKRSNTEEERWTDDEEEEIVEQQAEEEERRLRRSKRKPPPSPSFLRSSFSSFLRLIFFKYVLPYLLLFLALYVLITTAKSYLYSFLPTLPLPAFLLTSLRPILAIPCAIGIGGSWCPPGRQEQWEQTSAAAARAASQGASQAVNIFQHLSELSDPKSVGLALHPVECWELATAVRYSSLDDREFLSTEMSKLGDQTRDLKEQVINVNAEGLNSMQWILHEFTRLEDLISSSSSATLSRKQEAALSRRIEALFERISTSLSKLLSSLDKAVPSATLASDSAHRIFDAVKHSAVETDAAWDQLDWGRKLIAGAGTSSKARHLRRDMELTRQSGLAVKGVWNALEATRFSLIDYSTHVGHFKAGVMGYHLSGHGLSAAEEIASLKDVMGEMRQAVESAKARNSRGIAGKKLPELEAS